MTANTKENCQGRRIKTAVCATRGKKHGKGKRRRSRTICPKYNKGYMAFQSMTLKLDAFLHLKCLYTG
jgi:hypothetical protein